jgi:subtilisin family serine protease
MFKTETILRRIVLASTSFAIFFTSCAKKIDTSSVSGDAVSSEAVGNENNDQKYVPNELLVKFKAGTSQASKNRLINSISARVTEKILTKTMQSFNDREGVLLLHTPLEVLEARNKMKSMEVEYAEPNYIYHHEAVSNDPFYVNARLWGVLGNILSPANQFGSQANEAWANNHIGSATVHVGVIDEGAMFTHTDLAGQIWTNPFDPVDGIDNDGNGYIDDIHGFDFDRSDNTTFDGFEDDHGTHVSGTIGAKGGNGTGIAGVNWKITMITAKFLGKNGGTLANAIKAIDYITDLKTRHHLLLPATNNSWGGGGFSLALKSAIDRANTANILFVAAAGNGGLDGVGDNNDVSPSYPASYTSPNIISVAAITITGGLSSFSNFGATSVDIGAPGSAIISTVPSNNLFPSSTYATFSGTSMATPHVTGGAALYAATHPTATAAAIKLAILSSATPTSSLSGRCVTGGRLNIGGF